MSKKIAKEETIQEKQQRVAKKIQNILNQEGMDLKIVQTIMVMPKN